MSGGYMGKLLIVDLSTGEMKEEPLDENICRQRAELEGTSQNHRQPAADRRSAGRGDGGHQCAGPPGYGLS